MSWIVLKPSLKPQLAAEAEGAVQSAAASATTSAGQKRRTGSGTSMRSLGGVPRTLVRLRPRVKRPDLCRQSGMRIAIAIALLLLLAPIPAAAEPANLLGNAGFEAGAYHLAPTSSVPEGWNVWYQQRGPAD